MSKKLSKPLPMPSAGGSYTRKADGTLTPAKPAAQAQDITQKEPSNGA